MKQFAKMRGALAPLLAAAAVLSAGAPLPAPASEGSLKEIRAREADQRALQREANYTNTVCGSKLSAAIDWNSLARWPESESLVQACDGALGALEAACRNEDAKERLSRLSRFECAGDSSGPSLRGDVFRYGATPGFSGFDDTMEFLDRSF